ncbi:hypothetical protein KO481_23900 [Nocardia sp. NEAU-G5]|uniref:Tetracyclin repressor-like C-terminal domain-containing protein n=1 Tax=Nocardia albiluteola TaxID=2842303 RepID=A0ABS6B2N8_9NOCA|nr:hypothetical protein [Nocardia albiluteola]MBU3064562.1 hypothetical protein [Nocardia albiluteola]
MDDAVARSGTAASTIEQLIRSLAQISACYPILLGGHGIDTSAGDQDSHRATDLDTAALVERFEAQIVRGQRDHSIRNDLAPDILRHAIFGAISSSLRPALQHGSGGRLTYEDITEQVVALLVRGLQP